MKVNILLLILVIIVSLVSSSALLRAEASIKKLPENLSNVANNFGKNINNLGKNINGFGKNVKNLVIKPPPSPSHTVIQMDDLSDSIKVNTPTTPKSAEPLISPTTSTKNQSILKGKIELLESTIKEYDNQIKKLDEGKAVLTNMVNTGGVVLGVVGSGVTYHVTGSVPTTGLCASAIGSLALIYGSYCTTYNAKGVKEFRDKIGNTQNEITRKKNIALKIIAHTKQN